MRSCSLLFSWLRSLISDSVLPADHSRQCFPTFSGRSCLIETPKGLSTFPALVVWALLAGMLAALRLCLTHPAFCQSGSQSISDDLFVQQQLHQMWLLASVCVVVESAPQCLCLVWIDERSGVVTPLRYAIQLLFHCFCYQDFLYNEGEWTGNIQGKCSWLWVKYA